MSDKFQIPSRGEVLRRQESLGGVAAVFPIHPPRALLRAFDLLPVEVWGPPGRDTSQADAHLQTYTCSVVRAALAYLLDGKLDGVDLLVLPHACDSLQGLASVIQDYVKPKAPLLPLYVPRLCRPVDVEFLADELRAAFERLCALFGRRPSAEVLGEAVAREEVADQVLAELLARRPSLTFSNRGFYELVRSREYLPAEEFILLTREAMTLFEGEPPHRLRAVISGLLPEPMSILDACDQASLLLAGDDLACAGRRQFRPSSRTDLFERMAEGLLSGPPDPIRGCPAKERLEHLLGLARHCGADGVIHLIIKFCEPELFYLPIIDRGLRQAGLRTLTLEVDIVAPFLDSAVTRLEAFAETLA